MQHPSGKQRGRHGSCSTLQVLFAGDDRFEKLKRRQIAPNPEEQEKNKSHLVQDVHSFALLNEFIVWPRPSSS